MSSYDGDERRKEYQCAGQDCVNMVRVTGDIKGNNKLMKWVIGFLASTLILQVINNRSLTKFKEEHSGDLAVEKVEISNIKRTAEDALSYWKSHMAEKLPEKGRAVHADFEKRITRNEYEIELLKK